jgi:hypothetical protein
MTPQDSTTICKKNSKGANVSIPIELQKKIIWKIIIYQAW